MILLEDLRAGEATPIDGSLDDALLLASKFVDRRLVLQTDFGPRLSLWPKGLDGPSRVCVHVTWKSEEGRREEVKHFDALCAALEHRRELSQIVASGSWARHVGAENPEIRIVGKFGKETIAIQ